MYGDAGYQGIAKRPEMAGKTAEFRVAMRPGKRRDLPDTPEGRLGDLVETAKAHIRSKGEHPFRVIKQQFGFQKIRLRGMAKNRCKINVLAALSNLFQARRQLIAEPDQGLGVSEHLDLATKTSRKWLNRRPKGHSKWPQRSLQVKDSHFWPLPPLKPRLS